MLKDFRNIFLADVVNSCKKNIAKILREVNFSQYLFLAAVVLTALCGFRSDSPYTGIDFVNNNHKEIGIKS